MLNFLIHPSTESRSSAGDILRRTESKMPCCRSVAEEEGSTGAWPCRSLVLVLSSVVNGCLLRAISTGGLDGKAKLSELRLACCAGSLIGELVLGGALDDGGFLVLSVTSNVSLVGGSRADELGSGVGSEPLRLEYLASTLPFLARLLVWYVVLVLAFLFLGSSAFDSSTVVASSSSLGGFSFSSGNGRVRFGGSIRLSVALSVKILSDCVCVALIGRAS